MDRPSPDPELLKAALAKVSPEEIAVALQRANPELLRRLQELAASAQPAEPAPTADAPAREDVGAHIGPYRLLQELGEGGMGVVYMAEQKHPVERRVALKIIKPGMDSRQVIARFETERQALAMMDHPNVAKVLDAGTTSGGRPYFVMELVKGVPITAYCSQRNATLKERLVLFIPVCLAVQHAHQKGIIHRDLKPSNVLVALYDEQPVPKVIDFGVAKATSCKLTDKTMFTHFGQVVGTLEYMSPEQASFNQLDIDSRADIYSLGVLLYELLTGDTPFEHQRLRSVAFDEVMKIIREEIPPKPSTKVSTLATSARIGTGCRREFSAQARAMRGDLDWVVMKALSKERGQRYQTASELADDLRRHLTHEPVHARAPSLIYRARRFVRRNRTFVVALALVFAALVTAVGLISWQMHNAIRERERAENAEDMALSSMEQLAEEMALRGDYDQSREVGVKLLDLLERREGRQHRRTLAALDQLADTMICSQKADEAIVLCERALRDSPNDALDTELLRERKTRLAWACWQEAWSLCVSPYQESESYEKARKLADRAAGLAADVEHWKTEDIWKKAGIQLAIAAVHLRTGSPEQSIRALEELETVQGVGGLLFVPAMAHCELGNRGVAEAYFLVASDGLRGFRKGVLGGRREELTTRDRLWIQRLLPLEREAAAMLGVNESDLWHDRSPEQFIAAYTLLLQQFPETVMFYERRARHLARLSRFQEATDDLAKAVKLARSASRLRNLGVWCLFCGERDAYTEICRTALRWVAEREKAEDTADVLLLCSISHELAVDRQDLQDMIQPLKRPEWDEACGLALLRCGDDRRAIERLESQVSVTAELASAIAYVHLSRPEMARRLFDSAVGQLDEIAGGGIDIWDGDLHQYAIEQLLLKEVRSLVQDRQ